MRWSYNLFIVGRCMLETKRKSSRQKRNLLYDYCLPHQKWPEIVCFLWGLKDKQIKQIQNAICHLSHLIQLAIFTKIAFSLSARRLPPLILFRILIHCHVNYLLNQEAEFAWCSKPSVHLHHRRHVWHQIGFLHWEVKASGHQLKWETERQ